MGKANVHLAAFNRGVVDRRALGRVDLQRIALSAEDQTNWMPRSLGSMTIRPGWRYLGSTRNNAKARFLDFIFATDDVAKIELTGGWMRVWVGDAVLTRGAVSTAITNGDFASDLTGWTDADETGGTSSWGTGGYLSLQGSTYAAAKRTQALAIASGDINVEHGLRVDIERGAVDVRIGSTSGGDDYLSASLAAGSHAVSFTPTTATVYLELSATTAYPTLVTIVAIDAAGAIELPTPWVEADLGKIRTVQSGNVIFVACDGYQPRKIERVGRGSRSWSVSLYDAPDGPFLNPNISSVRLTPSDIMGEITVTASGPIFEEDHVGSIWRQTSLGQYVEATLTGDGQWSDPIRISGVGDTRKFTLTRTGTWSATIRLQQSVGEPGSWVNGGATYTTNGVATIDDGLDNQVVYYRAGIDTGGYTSGTPTVALTYANGGLTGVFRVTRYLTPTSVEAIVLRTLGGTEATELWAEGQWSDKQGWPTAVTLFQGRLGWFGRDRINLSVSDAFSSFDADTEGDDGPISRTIGIGPVDIINWALPLQRLVIGAQGSEFTAKSSTFDEPLTPTAFSLIETSTQGSAAVAAVKVDKSGVFVQKSNVRVHEVSFDAQQQDYGSTDLSVLCPEIGSPGIVRLVVQRQPDTRVHAIRSDGTVAVLLMDRAENITCWVEVETDGLIEDAVVLPGNVEDSVYYCVARTVGGSTVRYLEKWAQESECVGGALCQLADSHVVYDGDPTTTIGGLAHLEGEDVVCWAGGADRGAFTVTDGAITIPEPASQACAGLPYEARFKSSKLAYAAQQGTALLQPKRIIRLGVLAQDIHARGLRYGSDFSHLNDLPRVVDGAVVDADHVWPDFDDRMFALDGTWDTDSRLCLVAAAPRPVTLLSAVVTVQTNE